MAPTTAATPLVQTQPPAIIHAEPDWSNGTVYLEWEPVPSAVHYTVYQNGDELAKTTDTWHVAKLRGPVDLFWVTATDGDTGLESQASGPVLTSGGPICPIATATIHPNDFPFVFWGMHEECIDWIWDLTGPNLIQFPGFSGMPGNSGNDGPGFINAMW